MSIASNGYSPDSENVYNSVEQIGQHIMKKCGTTDEQKQRANSTWRLTCSVSFPPPPPLVSILAPRTSSNSRSTLPSDPFTLSSSSPPSFDAKPLPSISLDAPCKKGVKGKACNVRQHVGMQMEYNWPQMKSKQKKADGDAWCYYDAENASSLCMVVQSLVSNVMA